MRLSLLLLAACADRSPTYHADLKPLIDNRCVTCHGDGGIGPFPLRDAEEVAAVGELVVQAVESRSMPPWKAHSDTQEFARNPALTDEEIARFRAWLDGGMQAGDPAEEPDPLPPIARVLPRTDFTLQMPEAYEPQAGSADDYRCFLIAWPETALTHVTGFEVHPGNSSVVHHVAAFLIRPDGITGPGVIDQFRGFDDAAPGPGYPCYGGPSGEGDSQVPAQQLAQWVPGSGATLFPEGVGIPVPPGSLIALQLHYNTPAWDGVPDQTSVDFVVEPTVERVGGFAPFLDPLWPLGSMPIPANTMGVTHRVQSDPRGFFELLNSDLDLTPGFDITGTMFHMHRLGQTGEVKVLRADGTEEHLLTVEPWDFDWQLSYDYAAPIGFEPGDRLSLSCTFDNDRATDTNWGEGSADEMCVANLFISTR